MFVLITRKYYNTVVSEGKYTTHLPTYHSCINTTHFQTTHFQTNKHWLVTNMVIQTNGRTCSRCVNSVTKPELRATSKHSASCRHRWSHGRPSTAPSGGTELILSEAAMATNAHGDSMADPAQLPLGGGQN